MSLCFVAAFALAQGEGENPDKAPAFKLKDIDGKEHSLADYKDKIVVLEWINHGCPFVKKHYKAGNMQKLQKTYTEKGVVWLSVCSSAPGKEGHMSPEDWKKKNEEVQGKASAILLDADGKVGKAYDAKVTPTMCIIDGKGVRAYDGAVDDAPMAQGEDIAKAKCHVQEVLDALLAGKASPVRRTKAYG
jgi:peroxiredoxin